jgi:hypothetical protein
VPLIAAAVVALLLLVGSALSRGGLEVPAGATTPTTATPTTAAPVTAPPATAAPETTPPPAKAKKHDKGG